MALDVQPFAAPADAADVKRRAHLVAAGQPIGGNAMLTAAQAA